MYADTIMVSKTGIDITYNTIIWAQYLLSFSIVDIGQRIQNMVRVMNSNIRPGFSTVIFMMLSISLPIICISLLKRVGGR